MADVRAVGAISQEELFRYIGEQAVHAYAQKLRTGELEQELAKYKKPAPTSLADLGIEQTGPLVRELPEDVTPVASVLGESNGS